MITLNKILNIETSDSIQQKIRENFIKCRKEKKLSREKLAQLSGINVGVIRRYEENGYISLSNLIDLAFTLDQVKGFKSLFSEINIKSLYNDKI